MTTTVSKISFTAMLAESGATSVLALPPDASAKLPSKGMNSVEGTINGAAFISTLEPDGNGGHLLRMDKEFCESVGVNVGDKIELEFTSTKVDPEPKVPSDLQKVLEADKEAKELWQDITSLARRDWIHWITSAKQAQTRARRINQTRSKLKDGKRRPCCFDYRCAVVSYEPN